MPKTIRRKPDALTRRWTRSAADERAVANGCRFDLSRGIFVIYWIERYCRLYEGEFAGQPLILRGCAECTYKLPSLVNSPWDDEAKGIALERATLHDKCFHAGHHLDWPYEVLMRLFSWVRYSGDWAREIRRFRKAGIWVPKKCKKSPTLASCGAYLLCGDGEMGQKVYSVAKDGKQATITHTHALEMVSRSPELSSECKINRSTGQITHLPTSSFYKIVAGDNPCSQEGLNGSVMVDETHVVDRRLMKILKGAGISRSEPLQIEVSTAGNNPDGYGKERFDRGQKVEKAEPGFEDDEFFFVSYAAPQTLPDLDLEADPVKWGKLANPSWGHTIKPSEFLHDYQTARASLADLADFKMYRLNIWQSSANPWLRTSDWERCREAFTEADLAGKVCYAGLDLSKTRDMSALVLIFPTEEPEAFRILPYFWLPEKVAHEKNHLAPFLAWQASGYLELTPGDVIDYGFIRSRFRKSAKLFQIRELAYDQTYAEETTQALEQGVTDDTGKVIEEGTGVKRFVFKQAIMQFAAPCKDFERLIIAGKLHHNGHPIMNWQIGHVQVKTDVNQNLRPVKPSRDDVRKIDGVVAAIMSLGVAMQHKDDGHSVYETRGMATVSLDEDDDFPTTAAEPVAQRERVFSPWDGLDDED